jgi:hypothetical protein
MWDGSYIRIIKQGPVFNSLPLAVCVWQTTASHEHSNSAGDNVSVRPSLCTKPDTLRSVMPDESYIVIVKQGPIFDGLLFAVGSGEQKQEMKGTGRSSVGS